MSPKIGGWQGSNSFKYKVAWAMIDITIKGLGRSDGRSEVLAA